MKQKKLLFHNKVLLLFLLIPGVNNAQINNVLNGSFEITYTCSYNSFNFKNVVGWNSVDSINNAFAAVYTNTCQPWGCCTVPLNSYSYQFPRTGSGYVMIQMFAPGFPPERGYIKNRIKTKLKPGAKYCASMHLNNVHNCMYSIDGIGMYFGGPEIDTFSTPNSAMPNIIPQIELSSILFDTLNWVQLTGTFVASGNEKYLVIGCFKSNSAVNYSVTNSSWPEWAGYNIDDVSCIELDETFAGPDTTILPGDSLFIGKHADDDWLEARFNWYKAPATAAFDSTTGFWVKPVVTSTYVVKQQICSYTIWDTVVIKIKEDDVRVAKYRTDYLKVFPVPVKEQLELKTLAPEWYKGIKYYSITNSLGVQLLNAEIDLSTGKLLIDVSMLQAGAYTLLLFGDGGQRVVKRILISR